MSKQRRIARQAREVWINADEMMKAYYNVAHANELAMEQLNQLRGKIEAVKEELDQMNTFVLIEMGTIQAKLMEQGREDLTLRSVPLRMPDEDIPF